MNWRLIVTVIGGTLGALLGIHGAVAFVQWEWTWVSEWTEEGRAAAGALAIWCGLGSAAVKALKQ